MMKRAALITIVVAFDSFVAKEGTLVLDLAAKDAFTKR
jgi:hypothetical protein